MDIMLIQFSVVQEVDAIAVDPQSFQRAHSVTLERILGSEQRPMMVCAVVDHSFTLADLAKPFDSCLKMQR